MAWAEPYDPYNTPVRTYDPVRGWHVEGAAEWAPGLESFDWNKPSPWGPATPEINEGALHPTGFWKQFGLGMAGPVIDVATKLKMMKPPPAPFTFSEKAGRFVGDMIGYAAMFLIPAEAAIARIGLPAFAKLAAIPKYGKLASAVAKQAAVGASFGAFQAWAKDEPYGKRMLSEAAAFGAFPLLGAGAGAVAKKLGIFQKVAKPGVLGAMDLVVPQTASQMLPFARGMKGMVAKDLEPILRDIESRVLRAGVKIKPTLPTDPAKRIRAIMWDMRDNPQAAELLQPILDIGRPNYFTSLLNRATPKEQALITAVASKLKPAEIPVAGTTLADQLAPLDILISSEKGKLRNFLTRHKVRTVGELFRLPDLSKQTVRAVNKRIQRLGELQDMTWKVGARLGEAKALGFTNPANIPSQSLLKALRETFRAGKMPLEAYWSPNLGALAKQAEALTKQPIQSFADLRNAFKSAAPEVKEEMRGILKTWVDEAKKLRASGQGYGARVLSGEVIPIFDTAIQTDMVKQMRELNWQDFLGVEASITGATVKGGKGFEMSTHLATYAEELMLGTKPIPFLYHLLPGRAMFGETAAVQARTAHQGDLTFRAQYLGSKGLRGWMETLGLKGAELRGAGQRIFATLDNPDALPGGLYRLGKQAIEQGATPSAEVTAFAKKLGLADAKELSVAYQMRQSLDEIFTRMGLKLETYIQDYMPHIKKMSGLDWDIVAARLRQRGADKKAIDSIRWIHELERMGSKFAWDNNAFSAFSSYVNGASKKLNWETYLEQWTDTFEKMLKAKKMDPTRFEQWTTFTHMVKGQPSTTERFLNTGIRATADWMNKTLGLKWETGSRPSMAAAAFLTDLQYHGGLGGNLFAVAKNLTQKILILPEIADNGDPIVGLRYILRARKFKTTSEGQAVLKLNGITNSREAAEGLQAMEGATERIFRNIMSPEKAKKAADLPMSLFQWADRDNINDAFLAKFLYLMDKGAPVQDAAHLAMSTAAATQFLYGMADSPMLFRYNPITKLAGVFMTWPINWAMLIANQSQENFRKAITTVGLMAVGAEALSLTGMSFRATHPTEVARGLLPVAMFGDENQLPMNMRTYADTKAMLQALVSGDLDAIDSAFKNFKDRMMVFVPGGVQGHRILNFIELARRNWSKVDERGRLTKETTPWEGVRSLLGSTVEAETRWNDQIEVQKVQGKYQRMRRLALQAYLEGDLPRFQRLQDQLYANYGTFIDRAAILQERKQRDLLPYERQLSGLPTETRSALLKQKGLYEPPVVEWNFGGQ